MKESPMIMIDASIITSLCHSGRQLVGPRMGLPAEALKCRCLVVSLFDDCCFANSSAALRSRATVCASDVSFDARAARIRCQHSAGRMRLRCTRPWARALSAARWFAKRRAIPGSECLAGRPRAITGASNADRAEGTNCFLRSSRASRDQSTGRVTSSAHSGQLRRRRSTQRRQHHSGQDDLLRRRLVRA